MTVRYTSILTIVMSVIASVYYCIAVSGQLKSGKRLSWHWTVMPNLKKDLLGIAKVTWGICTLMVYLWPNCLKNELKNYRGVMFHGNEKWCQIWRRIYVLLQKWHNEFGKFSCKHLKVSKFVLWSSTYVQNVESISQKVTEELCVISLNSDAKNFKKILLVVAKMIWGIWRVLIQALKSLETGTLMGSFCPKYINVWAKKLQRSYV